MCMCTYGLHVCVYVYSHVCVQVYAYAHVKGGWSGSLQQAS